MSYFLRYVIFQIIIKPGIAVRLSIRRKTGIQLMKDAIGKPRGATPATRFPAWSRLSMDSKIPLVPAASQAIVFSRGGICENVIISL